MERIVKSFENFLRNQKKFPFLLESFILLTYRGNLGNKLISYVTATSILLFVFILSFMILMFFLCFSSVNSLVNFNIFSLFLIIVGILVANIFVTPLWIGFNLMVYKDVFLTLKSDLSDLFFFIHSFDKRKMNLLFNSYFVSLLSLFMLVIFVLLFVRLVNLFYYFFSNSFISKLFFISFILSMIFKFFIFLIIFSFLFSFIFIPFIVFIKSNIDYFLNSETEVSFDISNLLKVVVTSLKLYFRNFLSFLVCGFVLSLGTLTIFGIVFFLPWVNLMVAVLVRRFLS